MAWHENRRAASAWRHGIIVFCHRQARLAAIMSVYGGMAHKTIAAAYGVNIVYRVKRALLSITITKHGIGNRYSCAAAASRQHQTWRAASRATAQNARKTSSVNIKRHHHQRHRHRRILCRRAAAARRMWRSGVISKEEACGISVSSSVAYQ